MKPTAQDRLENKIAKHRDNITELLNDIVAQIQNTTPRKDEQMYVLLQRVQHRIETARGRLMEIRAWKEAKKLVDHLQEESRLEGWRPISIKPSGESASDSMNIRLILLMVEGSPNAKTGWYFPTTEQFCLVGSPSPAENVIAWMPMPKAEPEK